MLDKDKLDELFDNLIQFALSLLERNGEFFPIGSTVMPNGEIRPVAVYDGDERPESQTVIDQLTVIFQQQADEGTILASAIAFDARIRSSQSGEISDAIVTRIRARDYARDVSLPYRLETKGLFKKTRTLGIGEVSASEGAQDVFL